jgi:hypothetical protein
MNLKGCGMKQLWGNMLTFAWKDWGRPQNLASRYPVCELKFGPGAYWTQNSFTTHTNITFTYKLIGRRMTSDFIVKNILQGLNCLQCICSSNEPSGSIVLLFWAQAYLKPKVTFLFLKLTTMGGGHRAVEQFEYMISSKNTQQKQEYHIYFTWMICS